jgi:hypothetical protein
MMPKLYVADFIIRLPRRKRAARGSVMMKYSMMMIGIATPRMTTISVKRDPAINGKNSKEGTIAVTRYRIYIAAAIPPAENRNGNTNRALPILI